MNGTGRRAAPTPRDARRVMDHGSSTIDARDGASPSSPRPLLLLPRPRGRPPRAMRTRRPQASGPTLSPHRGRGSTAGTGTRARGALELGAAVYCIQPPPGSSPPLLLCLRYRWPSPRSRRLQLIRCSALAPPDRCRPRFLRGQPPSPLSRGRQQLRVRRRAAGPSRSPTPDARHATLAAQCPARDARASTRTRSVSRAGYCARAPGVARPQATVRGGVKIRVGRAASAATDAVAWTRDRRGTGQGVPRGRPRRLTINVVYVAVQSDVSHLGEPP